MIYSEKAYQRLWDSMSVDDRRAILKECPEWSSWWIYDIVKKDWKQIRGKNEKYNVYWTIKTYMKHMPLYYRKKYGYEDYGP